MQEWLRGGHTRLLTLTGMGGSGKTRLALEAAAQLASHFAHAVSFVPLADLTDAARVPDALARSLGLQPSPAGGILEQCVTFLSSRPTLLVLDNFEQLPEAAALLVQTLLQQLPALSCLVTSRQPLGLSGEQELPLAPLPVPQAQEKGERSKEKGPDRAASGSPLSPLTCPLAVVLPACSCSWIGHGGYGPTSRSRPTMRRPLPNSAPAWKAFRSPSNLRQRGRPC